MTRLLDATKTVLCGVYKYSGIALAQETLARLGGRRFMAILLFHRVTDRIPEDGLTISTARFGRICRLLRRDFRVVELGRIFELLRAGGPFPSRTVAITFDDSYRDNLQAAHILTEHGLPATFFLPTGFIGTDKVFPWDRHLPRLPNLTWDDARTLVRLGFDVGSHTVTHANLGTLSCDEARCEICDSKVIIEQHLNRPVRWFAYPFGGRAHARPDLVSLTEQAGYEGCLSGYGGFILPGCNDHVLPREAVPYFRSLINLELHLRGCLEWYYACRRGLGLLDDTRHPFRDLEMTLEQPKPNYVHVD
jgi:peptidoglycan/xylan/chitin deacetylase (PgdA/CDA1 family)